MKELARQWRESNDSVLQEEPEIREPARVVLCQDIYGPGSPTSRCDRSFDPEKKVRWASLNRMFKNIAYDTTTFEHELPMYTVSFDGEVGHGHLLIRLTKMMSPLIVVFLTLKMEVEPKNGWHLR